MLNTLYDLLKYIKYPIYFQVKSLIKTLANSLLTLKMYF